MQQLPTSTNASGRVTVAAIDIGTNSFHLVVVRSAAGGNSGSRLEVIDQVPS